MKYFLYSLFFLTLISIEAILAWMMHLLFHHSHPHAFVTACCFLAMFIILNTELIREALKHIKTH